MTPLPIGAAAMFALAAAMINSFLAFESGDATGGASAATGAAAPGAVDAAAARPAGRPLPGRGCQLGAVHPYAAIDYSCVLESAAGLLATGG